MFTSFDSSDLIVELSKDIAEFGDFELWAYSRKMENQRVYTDYDFLYDKELDGDQKPKITKGEKMEVMQASRLLTLLIEQNKLI